MKYNHDEEAYSSIQNSSKQKASNRIGTNGNAFQKNHLFHNDKAQSSASKEEKFDTNNMKKYISNSGELKSCNNNLFRNMGEHFLFKNLEYSQSIKSICFTSNADVNCIKKENSLIISTGNNKHFTQKLINNGRNVKLTIKEDFSNKIHNNNIEHMLTSNEKLYEDKTTYCRPVLNYYNQQFLYKTMERNAKLKNLVKKLSIARQREKEKVNWNNFINELKNKHGYGHDDYLLDDVSPEIISDSDNTTFSSQKSRLCKSILQDFYGAYDTLKSNRLHAQYEQPPQNIQYLPCNNNPYCYPTSSMGRLIMLKREQENYKYLKCKSIKAEDTCNSEANNALTNKSYDTNSDGYKHMNLKNFKSSLVQVNNRAIPPFIENIQKHKAVSNREMICSHKSNETNTVDEINNINLENTNKLSLVNIENKLECLIIAINKFMIQIKSRERVDQDKCKTVPYKIDEKINIVKSDSLDMRDKENKVMQEVKANNSGSTLSPAYGSRSVEYNSKINDILKEVNINNQAVKNEFKNILNKTFSAQISIEVPTKDCCTEVTKSLSKQKVGNEVIEEIIRSKRLSIQEQIFPTQRMTIAVNTDPLSFLALLRFSTETLKRLISYMPNFDYISSLSALSFLPSPRTAETSYICKICGAAFDNPTQLSDHINGHELGKARDCCVCRHVLERARNSLFSCQYCGQHFTRAYCCELHQQSCAKRFGKCHNAASSLMLLR